MKYFCLIIIFISLTLLPAIAQTNHPSDPVQRTQQAPSVTNKRAEKGLKKETKKEKKAEKSESRRKRRAHKISNKPKSKGIFKKRKRNSRTGERID